MEDVTDLVQGANGALAWITAVNTQVDCVTDENGLVRTCRTDKTYEVRVIGSGASIDSDLLDGGAGSDAAIHEGRDESLVVTLGDGRPDGSAGEGDRLPAVEGVTGGQGRDRYRYSCRAGHAASDSAHAAGGCSRPPVRAGAAPP